MDGKGSSMGTSRAVLGRPPGRPGPHSPAPAIFQRRAFDQRFSRKCEPFRVLNTLVLITAFRHPALTLDRTPRACEGPACRLELRARRAFGLDSAD